MRTPEAREKDEICKYLKSIGAWYFRPYMAGFGKSGVPDIVFCYRGRFGAIEVKREGKAPTKLQWKRVLELQEVGSATFWGTAEKVIGELHDWVAAVFR